MSFYSPIRGNKQKEILIPGAFTLDRLAKEISCFLDLTEQASPNFLYIESTFYESSPETALCQ